MEQGLTLAAYSSLHEVTMTNPQKLNQLLQGLSPAKQQVVEEFIQALAKDARPAPTFRQALDQFKRTHPELLRLLSQCLLSV